jgi:RNA polymerase sigma-70 factor (ECF subfamily)
MAGMEERGKAVAGWLAQARTGQPGAGESLGQALEACRGYLLLIAQQEMDPELQAKGGASDLVQETFLKAHRHFGRFHGDTEAELLAWLRRMLLNNLIDFRRLYWETAKRQANKEIPLAAGGSSCEQAPEPAGSELSPSRVAMKGEQAQAIAQALERLPEDYRQVLIWRQQEDLTFEVIGQRLNRSADAARKLWARAVERLQQEWDTPP